MTRGTTRRLLTAAASALSLALLAACSTAAWTTPPAAAPAPATAPVADYRADLEVIPGDGTPRSTVTGAVFDDTDRDGSRDPGEAGVPGVAVSNGREVVRTDPQGAYVLPAYDDMTVSVTKPADRAVPLDEDGVPRFAYAHKPAGSPTPMRFGGLPPTGPLPAAINFPTVAAPVTDRFRCIAMGDTQTYSNTEVGYVRDSVATDLARRDVGNAADTSCMLLLGDVMGDDLGLLPRFTEMMGSVGLPQYYAFGNHDYDFDATSRADAADSWRRLYGPTYYSFDIGRVHFVTLDNVAYPCTPADDPDGTRPHCADPVGDPDYTGKLGERQLAWLANDLATVPRDKLIVFSHHIPFLSFIDHDSTKHQTVDLARLYEIVGDRPALSLSGHTHTVENLLPGDRLAGWPQATGVASPRFPHTVAGAPSGLWHTGDLGTDGVPMALSRMGEPRGWYTLDFDGTRVTDTFHAAGQAPDRQMALSFDTPRYREWATRLFDFYDSGPGESDESAVPPLSRGDLGDTKLVTPADLAQGVSLAANVWNGSTASRVAVAIDDGPPVPMTHTQPHRGETIAEGPAFSDPAAVVRQLQIDRAAQRSTSGDERAQGYEAYRGQQFGPAGPRPVRTESVAKQSGHLWRLPVPADLAVGTHVATVTHTDRHGRVDTDRILFEVRDERPAPLWRAELWPPEESDG